MAEGQAQQPEEPTLADDGSGEHGRVGYGKFGKWTPIGLGLLLVLVVGVGWYVEQQRSAAPPVVSSPAPMREDAPPFTLTLFDGSTISSADLAGKVVVLNFWASWCEPCRNEVPVLEEFWKDQQAAGEDTVVIGVGIRTDKQADAEAFVEEFGITYPVGRDTQTDQPGVGPIETAFDIPAAYPSTMFIGPDGTITRFHLGPITESQLAYGVAEARQEAP